jgi:hypothetical protein
MENTKFFLSSNYSQNMPTAREQINVFKTSAVAELTV